MKRKLLSAIMVLSIIIIVLGEVSASEGKYGDLYYYISDGEVMITDCATSVSGEVIIPDSIDGYSVTSIKSYAFSSCSNLTSVKIPDSVTSIGNNAFSSCSNLTSIEIPDGVTAIENSTFYNCKSLASIEIPDSVTSIGDSAFNSCSSLTSVTIGNGVASIGYDAFYNCSKIEKFYITDLAAYLNCEYGGLSSNPMCYADEMYLKDEPVKSIEIPDSVTKIPDYAFYECDSLTDIEIPDSVTSIGSYAFYKCDSLTDIEIPDSVTSIGKYAFYYCSSLTDIEIPDSVTSIGSYAFYNCDSLTDIEIPDSVTSIGSYAFYYCDVLTNVTMGSGVKSIGDAAFYECSSIERFYITDLAAYLNCEYGSQSSNPMYYADKIYLNGKRLIKAEIPDSVTKIPDYAFYYCSSLTTVVIPDSIVSIGDYAFSNCDDLTAIEIPDSVTSIGNSAFSDCDGLISIEIPDSVTSIGHSAFYSCGGLTSVTIGSGVKSIGESAFSYCSGLTEVEIPDSVTNIGGYAFSDCDGLTDIEIPDSVTSIGNYTFNDCNGLTSVTIGSGLTRCGEYVFQSCNRLTSVTIEEGVDTVGKYMFYQCSSLTDINLPETMETIDVYAFYNCSALTEITIPRNLIEIEQYAFGGCSKLTDVYYNGNQDEWDEIYIGSNNTYLKNANRNFFLYVTLLNTDGNEISKKKYNAGDKIDISDIEEVLKQIRLYRDKDCTEEFDSDTPVNENLVLTIKYVPNQYPSKFVDYNGDVIREELIDYGAVIIPPENPEREGTQQYSYSFAGWSGFTEGITQDSREMVFVAEYIETINTYTYKFTDTDGTVLEEKTVEYGSVIEVPEKSFDKDHAVFDHWEGYTEGMIITEDISFKAVYKYKTFYITVSGIDKTYDVGYGNAFSLEVQEPEEEFSFNGYYTEENGKGTKITDEKGNSIENYVFTEDITVYPYFRHELLNKILITDENSETEGSADVSRQVYFATDKDAGYLICTIKYSEDVILKEIIAKDFKYISKGAEEIRDGYIYQSLICQYTDNLDNIPNNKKIEPFELVFDISEVASVQNANVEITPDTVLVGEEDYAFDYIINNNTEIEEMPVRNIEIIGDDLIVLEDGEVSFTAVVTPGWATVKEVWWSVSDEKFATISDEGVLTPLSVGTVTVTATAKDGSGVTAQKEVEIKEFAKITALKSNIGHWDKEFEAGIREYTIYVPENTTKISFTPTFTSGTLVINGTFAINKRAITVNLPEDNNVIFVRSNASGYADSEYKITIVRFEGVQTTLSEDGSLFEVTPINIENGKTVILALYDGNKFVETQTVVYEGEALTFITDKEYTDAKVMVWGDLTTLEPVCREETVE